ncbi:glycosyltransferase family 2 protein, partial [Candidatus Pelagibacter communis]|uniref:glycosyltransferase family 2 protein n=1 Tax=Pelagibacter ubique TaxID=198252 RepID=UPI000AE11DFE
MKKIIILIPVYNDWRSVEKLIEDINLKVKNINSEFSIFLINDGSTEKYDDKRFSTEEIKVKVISLLTNVGHTRAIATGLRYINEKEDFDYVIPMDGDGEDRPDEISKFIESTDYYVDKAIVGERIKRSEGSIFTFFYVVH